MTRRNYLVGKSVSCIVKKGMYVAFHSTGANLKYSLNTLQCLKRVTLIHSPIKQLASLKCICAVMIRM